MNRTVNLAVISVIVLCGAAMSHPTPLIDFDRTDADDWTVVNDGVMGGRSQSAIASNGDGSARFSGTVSLENNGGFASVRTRPTKEATVDADGVELEVRGDGRTYQIRFRVDDRFDGAAYRAEFATERDAWVRVRIPFTEFVPTFRGRVLSGVEPLDPDRIHQLTFMIADKTAGPFRLDIRSVETWAAEDDED